MSSPIVLIPYSTVLWCQSARHKVFGWFHIAASRFWVYFTGFGANSNQRFWDWATRGKSLVTICTNSCRQFLALSITNLKSVAVLQTTSRNDYVWATKLAPVTSEPHTIHTVTCIMFQLRLMFLADFLIPPQLLSASSALARFLSIRAALRKHLAPPSTIICCCGVWHLEASWRVQLTREQQNP